MKRLDDEFYALAGDELPTAKRKRHVTSNLRILGIPEVPKPPKLAKRGGVWFENEFLKIHIGVENDFHPARKAHPAPLVEDLNGLVVLLREGIRRDG